MKVYQIISFSLNDEVVCNIDILKVYRSMESAMRYMNDIPNKLTGIDYECSFADDILILYRCAIECEDDYGEPDTKYYNIIRLDVSDE